MARRSVAGPVAVFLVFVGIFATGAGLGQATGPSSAGGWFGDLLDGGLFDGGLFGGDDPPPREFPVLEPSPPIRIRIPSIKVRAGVHRVGLARDGSIAVPPIERHSEAGWYAGGPSPGQFGPAIIVGHVDSRDGPSVFHDVARLREGAAVEVTRRDRRVAIFNVTSVERFGKDRLPAKRVYADYERPGLRLITCGGRWLGPGTGYADNVIVFATLVDVRRA